MFKPSHTLPTMTVEQFGELEAAAARERAAAEQAQQRAEQERVAGLASDDEAEDDRVKHKVWCVGRPHAFGVGVVGLAWRRSTRCIPCRLGLWMTGRMTTRKAGATASCGPAADSVARECIHVDS